MNLLEPEPATSSLIYSQHGMNSKNRSKTASVFLTVGLFGFQEGWDSLLVYNVINNRLHIYNDEFFASFIESVTNASDEFVNGISSITNLDYRDNVKCLCFDAIKSPIFTFQEYKFYRGHDLLGGAGIFSLNSQYGLTINSIKMYLGKLAQYHLESKIRA